MADLSILKAIAEHSSDSFLITKTEPQGVPGGPEIVYANKMFTEITGYTAEEVIGRRPSLLQGPNTDRVETQKIAESLKAWKPITSTLLNTRKDGEEFWMQMNIFPIPDDQGWYHYWGAVQHDVSAQKERELKLQQALMEVETASLARENFLASASHDLRTPLNAIIGFSEIIENEYFGPIGQAKYREYITNIRKSGEILLDFVDNILLSDAPQSAEEMGDRSYVSLYSLLNDLQKSLGVYADLSGANIEYSGLETAPFVFSNARGLRQVILNLTTNALKANGDARPICIKVAQSARHVDLIIKDHGPGISDEVLTQVGQTVDTPTSAFKAEANGVGLGLSIVHRICRSLGIDIGFRRPAEGGTEAILRLPIAGVEAPLAQSA